MANIQMAWTLNSAVEQVGKYRIYQNGVLVGEAISSPVVLRGVTPRRHSFRVSAVNVWGEAMSNPVVIKVR